MIPNNCCRYQYQVSYPYMNIFPGDSLIINSENRSVDFMVSYVASYESLKFLILYVTYSIDNPVNSETPIHLH